MDKTYRSIAKANTTLGGTQVTVIIIGIIRSKLVAIFLGPSGLGIMGLFQSTIDLIKSATNMGLQTSAVRDVALANDSNNQHDIRVVKTVLSRLVWVTGMLGVLVTFIGAPYLSTITFSNLDYTLHFRILSVILLFSQISVQYNVILQGLRALRKLASANIVAALVGLIVNVPIFILFKEDGIVAVLIITAISSCVVGWFLTRGLNIQSVEMSWKDTFKKGSQMLKMGFLLGLTSLMDMLVVYIIKVAIQNWGTVAEVGLYTAGFAIVQQYVNIIFSSISTDYYPRLCSASNNVASMNEVVNKQFEILILVLTPLIAVLIPLSKVAIQILYSSEFVSISIMVNWIAFGMIFRAINWCPGYITLAKSKTLLYFVSYIVTIIVIIVVYLLMYKLCGLVGIGIGFTIVNFLSASSTILISKILFGFRYEKASYYLMTIALTVGGLLLGLSYINNPIIKFVSSGFIVIVCSLFSYKQLDTRLDLKEIKGSLVQKFKSR